MTVSKAYSYLERDGVVTRRPGRPLVVGPLENGALAGERTDQVRRSLEQTVTIVKQLGISDEEALGVFEEMLSARHDDSEEARMEDN